MLNFPAYTSLVQYLRRCIFNERLTGVYGNSCMRFWTLHLSRGEEVSGQKGDPRTSQTSRFNGSVINHHGWISGLISKRRVRWRSYNSGRGAQSMRRRLFLTYTHREETWSESDPEEINKEEKEKKQRRSEGGLENALLPFYTPSLLKKRKKF